MRESNGVIVWHCPGLKKSLIWRSPLGHRRMWRLYSLGMTDVKCLWGSDCTEYSCGCWFYVSVIATVHISYLFLLMKKLKEYWVYIEGLSHTFDFFFQINDVHLILASHLQIDSHQTWCFKVIFVPEYCTSTGMGAIISSLMYLEYHLKKDPVETSAPFH